MLTKIGNFIYSAAITFWLSWLIMLAYAGLVGSFLEYREMHDWFGHSLFEEFIIILCIMSCITIIRKIWSKYGKDRT